MRKCLMILVCFLLLGGNAFAANLVVFSGAGLMKPVEEIRKDFEKIHHVKVEVHYGNSGEIFAMVAAGRPCDVLIPGSEGYTQDALKHGWVIKNTIRKLVLHEPVIMVQKGNPKNILRLEDLARQGVRVALGDPKAPAIGRVSKKILVKAGLWKKVQPNIAVYAPMANQLLIYVALKQVDAAINWKDLSAWAQSRGKIETVPIEKKYDMIKTIPTAVCVNGKHRDWAEKFNNYVSSPEGLAIWKKWGFQPCAE